MAKLPFVMAELFLAISAGKAGVRLFKKSLGVEDDKHLPEDKKKHRYAKERVGINARDKDERGEHHSVVPVVYTAGAAALIL